MLNFWVPIVLLFAAATIGAIIARRKRDRCLKYFSRKPVLIEMNSGKWLWGRFAVYPQAIELIFESPMAGADGLVKASYVLYMPEIDGIKKILQPPPAVGTAEYDQWHKEIQRVANPSFPRRLRRWLWNVFNTLRDAVSQAFGMLLGTLKTKTLIGRVSGADRQVAQVGSTLIEAVPNAYEPVLEKYLSRRVIVEMIENGKVMEFAGLLQEYSAKYLLLRNVAYAPAVDTGIPHPGCFDIIFPRDKALVRHFLK